MVSSKSEKEAAEYYERELRLKLMENFVDPETKEDRGETSGPKKHKKTNSLKRIFSRKGK